MRYGRKHISTKTYLTTLALAGCIYNSAVADTLPGFNISQLADMGFNSSAVYDINNFGYAVGSSISGGGVDAESRPVLWDPEVNTSVDLNPVDNNARLRTSVFSKLFC